MLDAYLSKGEVYLRESGKLMDLREKAFGTLTGDRINLNPYETFYLVEEERINVLDEMTRKTKSLQESRHFSVKGSPFPEELESPLFAV